MKGGSNMMLAMAAALMGSIPAAASRGVHRRVMAITRHDDATTKDRCLPKTLANGVAPSEYGMGYRPNQRKRRKLARSCGLHPANHGRAGA